MVSFKTNDFHSWFWEWMKQKFSSILPLSGPVSGSTSSQNRRDVFFWIIVICWYAILFQSTFVLFVIIIIYHYWCIGLGIYHSKIREILGETPMHAYIFSVFVRLTNDPSVSIFVLWTKSKLLWRNENEIKKNCFQRTFLVDIYRMRCCGCVKVLNAVLRISADRLHAVAASGRRINQFIKN